LGKLPERFQTKSAAAESFPKSSERNRIIAKASQSLPDEIAALRKLPEVFQLKSHHCESIPKSSGRNRPSPKVSRTLQDEIARHRKLPERFQTESAAAESFSPVMLNLFQHLPIVISYVIL
jgi:hypothetical protein